jgi:hypothetical protein
MHKVIDIDSRQARGGERGVYAGDRIAVLGRHLDRATFAGRRQQGDQIGEGATDIDSDLPSPM